MKMKKNTVKAKVGKNTTKRKKNKKYFKNFQKQQENNLKNSLINLKSIKRNEMFIISKVIIFFNIDYKKNIFMIYGLVHKVIVNNNFQVKNLIKYFKQMNTSMKYFINTMIKKDIK